jgi:hypothetical protein
VDASTTEALTEDVPISIPSKSIISQKLCNVLSSGYQFNAKIENRDA